MTSIAIGAGIGLVATLFVLWPLVRGSAAPALADVDTERVELLFAKEHLLQALKEIDFDHQMGKLTDEDHARLRADYRQRAIALMRRLDDGADDTDLEAAIEADVARARAGSSGEAPDPGSKPPAASMPRFCADCGAALGANASFCAACGHPVARAS